MNIQNLIFEEINSLILENLNMISPQEAVDRGMFGPVYHGTSQDKHELIDKEGFKVFVGHERDGAVTHGYLDNQYAMGYKPPIHHLGYGVYFTTSKTIAKEYNKGTTKGLTPYYLDVNNIETINFGSPNKMMQWWIDNGFDAELAKTGAQGRVDATIKLTNNLKSKYDAVWFKGAGGFKRLLDGDQIVVYDPNKIYRIDNTLVKDMEIGSKVVKVDNSSDNIHDFHKKLHIPTGMVGVVVNRRKIDDKFKHMHPENANYFYEVRFAKGGIQHVYDINIKPYKK